MRIGILGCGYVGSAAAKFWKSQNHTVVVTTRKIQKIEALRAVADEVYLLKEGDLFPFLNNLDALLISVAPDSSSTYVDTYLRIAESVIEALPHHPKLKQIFYTSSTSVYGEHQGDWVDENTSILPTQAKQECLYETEKLLLKASTDDLKVIILRLGEIYGPKREIADRLKAAPSKLFPGTGNNYTNLIHVNDIVRALDLLLNGQQVGIYNLCNDLHISRCALYDELCQKHQLPPVQWDPSAQPMHGGNKRVSNQKIKALGFVFTGISG